MHFTQAQLRSVVGITEETFRIWREALPPLHSKSGHGAIFSSADALALMVIHEIVSQYGAKVSKLRDIASSLFVACDNFERNPSSTALLVANLRTQRAALHAFETVGKALTESVFVVPLAALSERLRQALVPSQAPLLQLPLPLK